MAAKLKSVVGNLDEQASAGVRSAASPLATTPATDANGSRRRSHHLHAAPELSRDRTRAAEPRDDHAARRVPRCPVARTQLLVARRGICAGVSGTVAGGAGRGASGDRADIGGAQALPGL